MTWTAPKISRDDPPRVGDERTLLDAWLDYHRQTLLLKCAGLTAGELVRRSAEPSNLSLLGLVRHMAEVERGWFRHGFAREPVGTLYCSQERPEADLDDVAEAGAEQDIATFRQEVGLARAAVAGHSLDEVFLQGRRDAEVSLRWIYLHMIEEYARHNGHADLLRERIDGMTGD
jgi:uncharacterized damage-inducible protein DinB